MFLAYLQGIETGWWYPTEEAAQRVSSLPTRDWNTDGIEKAAAIGVEFLAYLQGIETLALIWKVVRMWNVSSLPTRDWNQREMGFGNEIICF